MKTIYTRLLNRLIATYGKTKIKDMSVITGPGESHNEMTDTRCRATIKVHMQRQSPFSRSCPCPQQIPLAPRVLHPMHKLPVLPSPFPTGLPEGTPTGSPGPGEQVSVSMLKAKKCIEQKLQGLSNSSLPTQCSLWVYSGFPSPHCKEFTALGQQRIF